MNAEISTDPAFTEKAAGHPLQENDRQEDRGQSDRRGDNGKEDLFQSFVSGFQGIHPRFYFMVDILQDHDSVVNH
jgi:hypothetical protein